MIDSTKKLFKPIQLGIVLLSFTVCVSHNVVGVEAATAGAKKPLTDIYIGEDAKSTVVAGKTAQEFNRRKQRQGAFWEDRYHATAIETGEHFHRCLVYLDLNIVRNGVVQHPSAWRHGGSMRYRIRR